MHFILESNCEHTWERAFLVINQAASASASSRKPWRPGTSPAGDSAEDSGYFTNTAHDVEDEPSLIDLITEVAGIWGASHNTYSILDSDFSGWRSKIVAIIRETVGPNAAMAAQLFILSFPSGPSDVTAGYVTGGSWTRGNALNSLVLNIYNASVLGNVESGVIGDFACQLENVFRDSGALSAFAATLNIEFDCSAI